MKRIHTSTKESGFTIVELMVATLVFSVILTVITVGVMSFTNRYYKGANVSTTQNAAQSILDTITQAIQFGSAIVQPTSPTSNYFCAGGYAFTYDKGILYTGSQTGLYMAPMGSTCAATTTGGKQLLGSNMRITNLTVSNAVSGSHLYSVSITVVFGANDLLCSPSQGNCNGSSMTTFWPVSDVQCKRTTGSQFCAVSTLTTTVEQRIGT